jgi:hypothetical protein
MCDPAPRLFIFTLLLRRHESMNPNGQPADVPGILYADIILACMSGAYNLDPNYWLVGGQGLRAAATDIQNPNIFMVMWQFAMGDGRFRALAGDILNWLGPPGR